MRRARARVVWSKLKRWLWAIASLVVLVGLVWASDWITLQDERTVFTADCERGTWQGARCSGRLVAGPRYRFHVLKAHGEVLFWSVGDAQPAGKLAPCAITDGREWACGPGADPGRTITLRMSRGRPIPTPGVATRPFHAVPKWRWWLLRCGITLGSDAAT
jgi:hypothetical protein